MPYLTGTPPTATSTGLRTGLGIPGYAHPLLAPTEWGELTRPGTPVHWVVLNVADGPGTRPDPHCLETTGRLRNAGVRVLGHLDAAHLGTAHLDTAHVAGADVEAPHVAAAQGARAFGEVISEAHRYLDWYRVDGFFLDRCPTERAALPAIRRTITTLRALRDEAHIVLGHGTHPHPGYAECADQLVTFRGSWSDYRWSQVAEWTADYPPDRFCHFVHGVPRPHLDEALRIARWQGAATIYFTDHTDRTDRGGRGGRADAWGTMPGYWDEIVSRIGTGVSE
ncbi:MULTISPECIES: spherulation-specific family 4 protein [unclassified Streptomyces]|uniref:spherulation-specific family 4 protein n=1 Tax=unclassified Streptomyces TaxID=2593676 RepID=UPI00236662FF|nr:MULTISPECIES: spherulation-specific family 4 protein [unclassified Streptomyces]MDF3145045.1 spherulation-specific family 4 protein [Streptomyces sp. T21Q-yed]WDF41091.1 spherulation-specific family 4 protein [Streptomyces sp. T12]